MARLFYHIAQDNLGNLLFDVTGTVRLAGTGTLATIYGDEAGTIPVPNPTTNHPSFGSFKFYVGPGSYDFYMAKSGYTFETLTGLQGLGTMAQQNANNVTITGGTIASTGITGGTVANLTGLSVTGQSTMTGSVGFHRSPETNASLSVQINRPGNYGIFFRQNADTGTEIPIVFHNAAGTVIGSINTTGAATSFNTSSDARLKHDVDDLVGELAVIQALRPVSFLWNADDTPGVGFLAVEVAAVLAGVITGEEGALDEAGGILPQMIDYSKLVPFLTGAIKTLAAQVTALEARVHVLEDALGV